MINLNIFLFSYNQHMPYQYSPNYSDGESMHSDFNADGGMPWQTEFYHNKWEQQQSCK